MSLEVHILSRCDMNPIPSDGQEVRVFATIRNEYSRLVYLLDYYRKLGVNRFFFIDNNSTDETLEYLCQQPDCHVFWTNDRYRPGKIHWQNELLNRFGTGHWCLIVDADELFTYPHSETVSIGAFCSYLDQEGAEAVSSFLLDMYSDRSSAEAVCEIGKPFTDICRYYDSDYKFLPRPALPNSKTPFPPEEPLGGPRLRLFYSEWNVKTPTTQWKMRLATQVGKLLLKVGAQALHTKIQGPPILYKVPLVKWRKGLVATIHSLATPVKLSAVTTALLHFKFFSDFHDKAEDAAKRGQYYGGGVEYKKYLQAYDAQNGVAFLYQGSREFQGSAQLVADGLMRTTPDYENYIQSA